VGNGAPSPGIGRKPGRRGWAAKGPRHGHHARRAAPRRRRQLPALPSGRGRWRWWRWSPPTRRRTGRAPRCAPRSVFAQSAPGLSIPTGGPLPPSRPRGERTLSRSPAGRLAEPVLSIVPRSAARSWRVRPRGPELACLAADYWIPPAWKIVADELVSWSRAAVAPGDPRQLAEHRCLGNGGGRRGVAAMRSAPGRSAPAGPLVSTSRQRPPRGRHPERARDLDRGAGPLDLAAVIAEYAGSGLSRTADR